MKQLFLASLLIFPLSVHGWGKGPLEKALDAYKRGDYEKALDLFIEAEKKEADSPVLQSRLGYMYYRGEGTRKDYEKAFNYSYEAAKQGDKMAQSVLGMMYKRGDGVSQNSSEALAWQIKSAEQGFAPAQFFAGHQYLFGQYQSVNTNNQDFAAAKKWFEKAAKQNHSEAVWGLGMLYVIGRPGGQDFVKAHEQFTKALLLETEENDLNEALKKSDGEFADYLEMTANRGYLAKALTADISGQSTLISSGTFVITLPNSKRILHPVDGILASEPQFKEAEDGQIEIKAFVDNSNSNDNKMLNVKIRLTTNFLVHKIYYDGAELPIDMAIPDDTPEKILTVASVAMTEDQLKGNTTLSIVSRNGNEYVRSLILSDNQLEAVTPAEIMFH